MWRRVVSWKKADVSDMRTASIIALMMEAVRTFETSVHFNVTTRRYMPEDSKLHTCRCDNLKSHTEIIRLQLELHRTHKYKIDSYFVLKRLVRIVTIRL
jgi:hypothetical protein